MMTVKKKGGKKIKWKKNDQELVLILVIIEFEVKTIGMKIEKKVGTGMKTIGLIGAGMKIIGSTEVEMKTQEVCLNWNKDKGNSLEVEVVIGEDSSSLALKEEGLSQWTEGERLNQPRGI